MERQTGRLDPQAGSNAPGGAKAVASMDDHTHEAVSAYGDETMRTINERIRDLLDEAPSDASAELLVRKGTGGYKGMLKIYSQQRKFVGGAQSERFLDVVDEIFREVREQIDDWKRDRYESFAGLE